MIDEDFKEVASGYHFLKCSGFCCECHSVAEELIREYYSQGLERAKEILETFPLLYDITKKLTCEEKAFSNGKSWFREYAISNIKAEIEKARGES